MKNPIFQLLDKTIYSFRINGSFKTLKRIFLRSNKKNKSINVLELYSFLDIEEFGQKNENLDVIKNEKHINFFIPDIGIGSGGHLNIFRFAKYMEEFNYTCDFIIVDNSQFPSERKALGIINNHFLELKKSNVIFDYKKAIPSKFSFATSWQTAYFLNKFQSTIHKCYFIQDFEPYFYPRSTEYYLAENTYKFNFIGFTAGNWLAQKIKHEYGMEAYPFAFSFDKELYRKKSQPRLNKEIKKILFYARPSTSRRCFELGLIALNKISASVKNLKVIFVGWDINNYIIPFNYENRGIEHPSQLSELYNECDLALVFSGTNLSLLPIELMASGCPVVSNKGHNVEWLLNEHNSILTNFDPEEISSTIIDLLKDEKKIKELEKKGLEFSSKTSWSLEFEKIKSAMEKL